MSFWLQHLPVLPIVTPLVAGALMLLLADTSRHARGAISPGVHRGPAGRRHRLWPPRAARRPGGVGSTWSAWAAPFGIVLVVDRLAAVMLTLTSVLGLATLIYALARWDRAGVHFHSLFQFLLMGLNGAFLTGDLFNLFVFFEVLLARPTACCCSGVARVSAGMQYIAVNLVASFLLLISIALIYGVTGTLNMADLALRAGAGRRRPHAVRGRRGGAGRGLPGQGGRLAAELLAGQGLLAGAPIAAMFSIMTKVGIYALLRIGSLAAHRRAGRLQPGLDVRRRPGDAAVRRPGAAGTQQLEKMVGYCVIVSAGTLLTALGMPGVTLTGPRCST